jgi:hypothetical protein
MRIDCESYGKQGNQTGSIFANWEFTLGSSEKITEVE